jgi:EAL domain-containing protein (putative c-di-GMP-specific phosphodiesterase class I)/PAS domain-containing protein
MGSIEVRNPLLSKKLKRTETRLLIIDDNQIRFNQISELLTSHEHHVQATLLDDLSSFEKQLNLKWDLVIFGRAYDLKYEQALTLIHHSNQADIPLLLLKPDDYMDEQYSTFIRKGVYDVLSPDHAEDFYLCLLRALSYSRLSQTQHQLMEQLETAQSQAQLLVEESNNAVAVIQEGIHVQANEEYLKLFGLKSEDDIIGLPILDMLQPRDLNDFKVRFKKISQGQFDLGGLSIHSLNSAVTAANPLRVEFLPSTEDDAVQISIDTAATAPPPSAEKSAKAAIYQQINRTLTQQPADVNALVLFSLAQCPEEIFTLDWHTSRRYFDQTKAFLKDQTNAPIFKFESGLYLALIQAEHKDKLDSKLMGLSSLAKTQLIQIDEHSFPLNLRIGFTALNQELRDEAQLESLIEQAFNAPLPTQSNTQTEEIVFEAPVISTVSIETPDLDIPLTVADSSSHLGAVGEPELMHEPAIIRSLRKVLDDGDIQLKYQQLYDKEDTNLYLYEVTAGFIFENKWKSLNQIRELAQEQELSIKLDRWVMVEACKQLHNFITQYPDARLIINLNKEVLLLDRTLPDLVSKLLTIIRSKLSHPLMLQFSEEEIGQYQENARKNILLLRKNGAEVSLRSFGDTIYSDSILREFEINGITLHDKLAQKLRSDRGLTELQERMTNFTDIRPEIQIMLRELNDMTSFANAWNVSARYLAGDYFQKKLDQLIDVQDQ